jgi:hypothetical protein
MTYPTEPAQPPATDAPPGAAPPEVAAEPAEPPIPPVEPPASRGRRRGVRTVAIVTLVAAGLVGVAGGGTALAREMTRKATKGEAAAALQQEIATRWQRLPAGKIFPATVSYRNAQGDNTTATLVGIAPAATCQASLEPSALQQIQSLGCTTMLRATYTDAAGTLAATVGIGVMPSPGAAGLAQSDLSAISSSTLYAVSFSGTLAAGFGNPERGASGAQVVGAYLFVYTAGYTDGMPGAAAGADAELPVLGFGILDALETNLTSHPSPCTMKDIHC